MVATTVSGGDCGAICDMHGCISATDRLLLEFLRTHEAMWEAAVETSCCGAVVLQPKLKRATVSRAYGYVESDCC